MLHLCFHLPIQFDANVFSFKLLGSLSNTTFFPVEGGGGYSAMKKNGKKKSDKGGIHHNSA